LRSENVRKYISRISYHQAFFKTDFKKINDILLLKLLTLKELEQLLSEKSFVYLLVFL